MQIGLVGLDRMGANMSRRWLAAGHTVVGYAEGLNILKHADARLRQREVSAEVTPLREPELYQYELDIPQVTEVWRRGSVVASWLLDLAAGSLVRSGDLSDFADRVLSAMRFGFGGHEDGKG